jgi:hypothetical protein
MRFMMVELNRLMNYVFETNCMPPIASGAKSQNTLIFIYEKNTWSVRSRLRSFTCSAFPLTSPMISTQDHMVHMGLPLLELNSSFLFLLEFWLWIA